MRLHFKEFGRGEPLVVLHGLFGSSDNWLGVAPRLAESFHVFILDLRNHGQSPHSGEMNYPLMAADVAEFLDTRKLESAFVLGHSMGGKVAMQLALDFPVRVEKLVVADMSPRAYPPEYEDFFPALLALDLNNPHSRREMEGALAPAIPSLAIRRFLLKNLGHNPDGTYFWKLNLRGIQSNYPRLSEAVAGERPFLKPALFISGGKSDYVLETDKPEIRNLLPGAQFHAILQAGHWLHADAPEEFVQSVIGFLNAGGGLSQSGKTAAAGLTRNKG